MNTLRDYFEFYQYEPFTMDFSHKKNKIAFSPLDLYIVFDKEDSLI